jgi:hypothetical protein
MQADLDRDRRPARRARRELRRGPSAASTPVSRCSWSPSSPAAIVSGVEKTPAGRSRALTRTAASKPGSRTRRTWRKTCPPRTACGTAGSKASVKAALASGPPPSPGAWLGASIPRSAVHPQMPRQAPATTSTRIARDGSTGVRRPPRRSPEVGHAPPPRSHCGAGYCTGRRRTNVGRGRWARRRRGKGRWRDATGRREGSGRTECIRRC